MKVFYQFDASDCGVTCIKMIAHHHNVSVSSAILRDVSGTDQNGANLVGIKKAAQAIGFETQIMKGEPSDIDSDLEMPFIAHVMDEERWHFVVVYKITSKGQVFVADPAKGKRKLTLQQFTDMWTGYLVFLNPTPEFKMDNKSKGRLSRFIPLFRPHLGTIAQSVVASLILTVLGIVGSFYFSYLVDEILPSKSEFALHVLTIGLIILTLFQVGLGTIRDFMLTHFSMKTSLALDFTYLKHILSQPLKFFDSRKVGEILSRFTDGEKVRGILSSVALSVLMDIFMMIVAGAVLISQNLLLFGVAVIAVPLSTAVIWAFAGFFRENYRKLQNQEEDSQSFLVETLNGMATIKGLNSSDRAFEEIEKRIMKTTRTSYKGSVMGRFKGFL
jgi:ABC-type bacteriocin/lantibiotic exporter with double-glycine peptidase domain